MYSCVKHEKAAAALEPHICVCTRFVPIHRLNMLSKRRRPDLPAASNKAQQCRLNP